MRLRRLGLLAACLVAAVLPARGEDPAGPGLDLLLLVDRSGSMSAHSPATIVDALPLALNVIAWSSRSARVNHRFGVVSFGSHAQTDVPLTIVDADSLPALRDRIGGLPSRSLGHTNLIAPFEAAADAFRALPADPRRRRAILLLTDGHLDAPGLREREVARRIEQLIDSALTTPPVSFDVLLFGARKTFPWARVASDRVHRVGSDPGDLLATLHRVVSGMTGARSTQQAISGASDTLVLPPYLELVIFDIYRGGTAQHVTVVPPGSSEPMTSSTPGVEEVHAGDLLSTVVVRRPAAGAWVFRKSDSSARVNVLSQQFFPRGVLVHPAVAPPVRQHEEVTIGYRLDDGTGRPLQELLGYPLSIDVSLALPDGQRVVLPMMRDPASPSPLYRTRPTECSVVGRYWAEVLVTTADSSGQPVRIFEDRWSGFTVEAGARRPISAPLLERGADRPVQSRMFQPWTVAVLAVPVLILLFLAMRRR
jgi:von Willebrand factor type A domain